MSERKKDVIHQSFGVMKGESGDHWFRPMGTEDAKIEELKKVMSHKPKDRRLLTRYLIARDSGMLQLELGKVQKELEESGCRDIQKELNDELKKRIQGILKVRK